MAQARQFRTPKPYRTVPAAARQQFAVRCDDQGGDRANVTFQGALESAAWRAPEKHAAVRAAARQHAAVQAEGERQDSIQLDVAVTFHGLQKLPLGKLPEPD